MTARLHDDVIEKIRELHAHGLSATAISEQLHLNRLTVMKYKRHMGLSAWPALPETRVLELLRAGVAPRAIAQTLGISYRGTRRFAHQNGYGKPPRKKLTAAQEQALMTDIVNRRASAMALAKRHKASYKQVLEMAHKLLACERFLPSWRTPLSSYLPAKYFDAGTR